MRWMWATLGIPALLGLSLVTSTSQTSPAYLSPGYQESERGLSPSERAGRAIWFYATAGNDRFHTYTFQQRLGVMIDWFRVLNSESRPDRFQDVGVDQRPRLLHARIAELSRQEPRRHLRLRLVPGRRDASDLRG